VAAFANNHKVIICEIPGFASLCDCHCSWGCPGFNRVGDFFNGPFASLHPSLTMFWQGSDFNGLEFSRLKLLI